MWDYLPCGFLLDSHPVESSYLLKKMIWVLDYEDEMCIDCNYYDVPI